MTKNQNYIKSAPNIWVRTNYNMGNKQDGKKLVEEAQKAGVKEADKVLEDIAKLEAKK